MTTWRHLRAPAVVVEAGSIWRLRCRDKTQAEQLCKLIAQVRQIGERQHEGFGWVTSWTGSANAGSAAGIGSASVSSVKQKPEDVKVAGKRQPWPGLEDIDIQEVLDVLSAARRARLTERDRAPLQWVAQELRGANANVTRVREVCQQKAARKNPGAWAAFRSDEHLARAFEPLWNQPAALVRFACEAMLTRIDLAALNRVGDTSAEGSGAGSQ